MSDYAVYVLYSFRANRLYIGETSNLIARFHSHNVLSNKGYTVRHRPWLVIHLEFYPNKIEARKREQALKSGRGRAWIRTTVLPEYL